MNIGNDYLQREEELERLEKIVENISTMGRGSTFAVDGSWGCGKTFFMKMFLRDMERIQREETSGDRFFTIYYDCWANNFYSEPVIPMLTEVLNRVSMDIPEAMRGTCAELKKGISEYVGKLVENQIGVNPIQMYQKVSQSGKALERETFSFDALYTLRQSLCSIRERLKDIAESQTILFVVDELDRCLPEYAIRVLENVHHVFSGIENVIVIFVIDRKELEQVIRTAYGDQIDTERYLRKIIDFYFCLGMGRPAESYADKYTEYCSKFSGTEEEKKETRKILNGLMEGLDIRTQEKIWRKAELIHSMITENEIDCSCMIFEIMLLKVKSKGGERMKGEWKGDLEKFSKSFGNNMISYNGKQYIMLKGSLIERVLWYWERISKKDIYEDVHICGPYFWSDYQEWEECIRIMKRFVQMAQMMN